MTDAGKKWGFANVWRKLNFAEEGIDRVFCQLHAYMVCK